MTKKVKSARKPASAKKPAPGRPPRWVVVCTEHRGVFFGAVVDERKLPAEITLRHARNCFEWAKVTRVVLGLASAGPAPGSKIGPACPQLRLFEISAVIDCTKQAAAAWEQGRWN